jgi:hypothetical protein
MNIMRIIMILQKIEQKLSPKMVITMDELAGTNYQGIQHIHILDFLQQ